MKHTMQFRSFCAIFCALLVLGASARADGFMDKFYVKADAGAAWVKDSTFQSVFGPVPAGDQIKFDVGYRLGAGVGYQLTDWLAPEFEIGAFRNGVKQINNASTTDVFLWNIPVLVNLKLQLPDSISKTIKPYIGAGLGGASTILAIDQLTYGGTDYEGNGADFVFAYQAFAGVKVAIAKNLDIGVEYRWSHTDAPSWDVEWNSSATIQDALSIGALNTQSASLIFNIRF
jgi:opacity protein-like surface antigen